MATEIHPTAIVAPGAVIGENCSIGPYCVIGEHVRLGAGTRLQSHVVIDGHTTLGENCHLFSFACIGKQTQDLKYKGGVAFVEIGAGTTLREYVTVNSATAEGGKTILGSNCHILAYSHIAHECVLGNNVVMSNSTHLAGHVTVGDRVVFGGMGGVHQFVQIGSLVMVSAMAKVVQDVVPFCLVEGNPATPVTINKIGLERNGKSPETIQAITKAFKLLFRSNLPMEAAVEQIRQQCADVEEVHAFIQFAAASERGLARPKAGE